MAQMETVITNIRREVRHLARAAPDEAILDKVREVEFLLDQVLVGDQYVDLLCESIRLKNVELSLVALRSIKSFIESDLINARSLQLITDSITKIEFKSNESELVEDGYHQAVRCCRAMLKCKTSNDLTNGSISEIIIFCFRVVNSKLVKWLRSKAARTLISITRIVFRRLEQFPDDLTLKPSYQIRLRLGGTSSQSTFKELADQFNNITTDLSSPAPSSFTPALVQNMSTNANTTPATTTATTTSSNVSSTPQTTASTSTTTASTTATTTQPPPPAAPTLRIINERNQPYNLAFINDYFCYLASLINPNYESEVPSKGSEEKMLLGLRLLSTAYGEAIDEIGKKSSLLYITKNNICCNIVSILKTSNRSMLLVSNALNLAVDIFVKLRFHLKYQFEAFLERLMELLAINTDNSLNSSASLSAAGLGGILELRSDVLTAILELFRNIANFPHELYYNYDCDPYSSNIYENLVQICSKNCFQQNSIENNFSPIQLTSFKCLLVNLADIYKVEIASDSNCPTHLARSGSLCYKLGILNEQDDYENPESKQIPDRPITLFNYHRLSVSNPAELSDKIKNRFPRSFSDLNEAKKRKRSLWLALEKFNARPKDGIQFIKDNKLIDNNKDLVQFLKDNLRVDKKILGEFLSKEENRPLREAFINSLDFNNLRIDEALRSMLEKFRLPGESQLIERILSTFSEHWFEQNPGILQSSDNALSLAYAIIILNVDQHSKKVKPMTCDEFDRNLTGPKGERYYDRQLLDQIYTNIRDNEIVLPDEQVGSVRQRYLWKCIMVKSERIDALYWVTGKLPINTYQNREVQPQGLEETHLNRVSESNSISVQQGYGYSVAPTVEVVPPDSEAISLTSSTTAAHQVVCPEPAKLPDSTILFINDDYDYDTPASLQSNADNKTVGFEVDTRLKLIDTNQILFEIMWSPTVAALAYIFDKIDTNLYPELSKQIVDQGFIRFAHLCAKYGHLDNLVVSLCKFTTDLMSPIPHHNHSGNQKHIMSDKNSLAALSLLSIIRDYANCMRDSWSNIVRNVLQWYCSKCIDDVVQVDDFALQRKLSLRMREIKKSPSTMNQQSSTFLRSVYTYFAGPQLSNEGKVQGDDEDASNNNNCAPSAIGILLQTIQDAEYCQESLIELITALTTTTIDGDPEEIEDAEVFKLEIFTQVILNNKAQAFTIWPKIRAYFARQASICGRSQWLGERIISAAFRVAILFEPKIEVFSLLGHIICTLDADIIRGDHTFLALTSLTELQSTNSITLSAQDLEACFNQVIFPFSDKVLDGCDPIQSDRTLNRAVNLLSKIFLKHHKRLRGLPTFCKLWVAILDNMGKFIKTNSIMKEAIEELVKNMVLVMANEECLTEDLKAKTWDRFSWMGIDPMKIVSDTF